MREKSASASLRISSPNDLTFVGVELQCKPTRERKKGSLKSPSHPDGTRYSENLWITESQLSEDVELESHIDAILKILERDMDATRRVVDFVESVDIFCMFSSENGQGSTTLGPGLLQRLASQGIHLTIDLYPPEASA